MKPLYFKEDITGTVIISDAVTSHGWQAVSEAQEFVRKRVVVNATEVTSIVFSGCHVIFREGVKLLQFTRLDTCNVSLKLAGLCQNVNIENCSGRLNLKGTLEYVNITDSYCIITNDGDSRGSIRNCNIGSERVRIVDCEIQSSSLENSSLRSCTLNGCTLKGEIESHDVVCTDPALVSFLSTMRHVTEMDDEIIWKGANATRILEPTGLMRTGDVGRFGRKATLFILQVPNIVKPVYEYYISAGCFLGNLSEFKADSAREHSAVPHRAESYRLWIEHHKKVFRNYKLHTHPVRFVTGFKLR